MKKKIFIGLLILSAIFCLTSCREVHFFTSTEEGLYLEFTEIWDGDQFKGKVIMNKISFEGESYDIDKKCVWKDSEINFAPGDITISGKVLNNVKWYNDEAWCVDCTDMDIMFREDKLASVQFGWAICNIDNIPHKVYLVSTKTYLGEEGGGIGGNNYYATCIQLD